MIRFISIFILNLLCGAISAQQVYFSNNYDFFGGSNFSGGISQTSDSGFVYVSCNYTVPNRGYTFVKLDKYGDTVFTRSYIYSGLYFQVGAYPNSMLIESNGDYLVCGWMSGGPNNKQGFVVRFNAVGDTLWTRMYGDTAQQDITTILPASTTGYWLGGSTTSGSNGTSDLWVVKLDQNFITLWDTSYSTAQNDALICGSVTWDRGLVVSGRSGNDPYVVKMDSLGRAEWKTVYSNYDGYGYINVAPDSGYYVVCGKIISAQDDEACLLKLDSSGNLTWFKYFGETTRKEAFSSQPIVTQSDIVMGGGSRLSSGYYDGYIVKTDLSGNTIWQRRYIKTQNEHHYIYDLEPTFDGGYIASGSCVVTTQDAWVLKLDSLGCDSVGCDGVGFSDPNPLTQLNIFPNPASEHIAVTLAGSVNVACVEILNSSGQLVDRIFFDEMNSISLSTQEYEEGIYFLRVISEGECVGTEKLVIVR